MSSGVPLPHNGREGVGNIYTQTKARVLAAITLQAARIVNAFSMKAFIFLSILALLCLCIECMQYKHHVELKAGVFDVYWTVNTSNPQTIYVKYVAKTTGWAALGWSKTPNGGGMIKYDIALGGVRNSNETYLKVGNLQ